MSLWGLFETFPLYNLIAQVVHTMYKPMYLLGYLFMLCIYVAS